MNIHYERLRADMVKMELRIYLGIAGMLVAGGFLLLRFLAAGP